MLDPDYADLAAVRSSFCLLVASWRLTQRELGDLLQVEGPMPPSRVLPDRFDASGETRVRLLLRLDRALSGLCGGGDVAHLLREPEVPGGPAPLDQLADLQVLRAAVLIAEGEPRPHARRARA